ncbi:XRE family transcriptional regulator [Actinobacteria bacterium YIM 96077]|uniref:Transcriptional regulator n=1 Tax=Phytoactinopolyspora halophila TaxID=1981511 RepID=A0A329QZE4_9ACTN|nr:helix-turn-helix transcriptional regulator [Phytoactinopolyspora halophila]AYY13270.1 XRE family transcriptional regulator [Actinobacteria bacterium YIM 96077]RAW17493.1 transcriptional regulator [Phytoactinopolyspora halophila]
MSDNELGAFLRSRREAVTPADVALPAGNRRRTPGLRRAELATLAGISVEYLTRLEQGRDRHPSPQVLGAIADALRMPTEERLHLRWLSKITAGDPSLCGAAEPPDRSVRATVQAMLDRLEPTPATVLNRLGDVLAFTGGYDHLARPFGLFDTQPPNVLRFLFTDPRAREIYPEWDRVADEHVATLRSAAPPEDPHVAALTEELEVSAGASFSDRLAAPPTLPQRTGVERLVHPEVGELRLAYEAFDVPGASGQRIVVLLPDDDATAGALDRLSGRRSGNLRAVPS